MSKQLSDLLPKISLHPGLSLDAKNQLAQAGQISFSGVTCHTGKVRAGDAFFLRGG